MQERTREDRPDADASVALLVGALGRICRYGAHLAALEVRERRRATVVMARFTAMAWVCMLTGWVGFNAGAVAFAYTHVGIDTWAVLLGTSAVNGLLGGVLVWRAQQRWKTLKRSPLQALVQ